VKLEEPLFIIAVHDDGRRIMVGPATTDAGLQRLRSSINDMGWRAGFEVPRMTRQAWFEMAYTERAADVERKRTPAPKPAAGEPAVPRDPEKWWCDGEECYGDVTEYPHVHTYPPRPLRAVDITNGSETDPETARRIREQLQEACR
jgi:hypothetical protein